MTWVVDTCIILDILDRHPEFAEMSSRALQSKLDDADVLIGAYAMQKGGLITRNEADFKTLYPNLTIYNPVSSAP